MLPDFYVILHSNPASAEIAAITDWNTYGFDKEAPFPETDTLNNVEIPEPRFLCATLT